MADSYGTFCDDFYVSMRLGSRMPMPAERSTVLHFLEQISRAYPSFGNLRRGDGGETFIDEPRVDNRYRWLSLEQQRLAAGAVNPESLDDARKFLTLPLRMAPHTLGISRLEIDYLDVLMGFDLEFNGNHDEIVAESLFGDSPMTCLLNMTGSRPVQISPQVTVALDDDPDLHARLECVTRTIAPNRAEPDGDENIISLYLTVRRFWRSQSEEDLEQVYSTLLTRADELAAELVVPRVLRPMSDAIASRS